MLEAPGPTMGDLQSAAGHFLSTVGQVAVVFAVAGDFSAEGGGGAAQDLGDGPKREAPGRHDG